MRALTEEKLGRIDRNGLDASKEERNNDQTIKEMGKNKCRRGKLRKV